MDVISSAAEKRNKCDDNKSNFDLVDKSQNGNIESISSFGDENKIGNRPDLVGETKELEVIPDTRLDNVDKINQFCKYEENKITKLPKIKSLEDDNNIIKRSLDNCNIYNSDTLNIINNTKSDTSVTACTTYTIKQNKSVIDEVPVPGIQKVSPNETSDTFRKFLVHTSLDENLKVGAISSPYLSNNFCEKVCTEVEVHENTFNKKSSQPENMNRTIITKNNDIEILCNSDNQISKPHSSSFITENFSQVTSEDSFFVDNNKINSGSVYRTMKRRDSYECRDNMTNENTLNTYNNSKVVGISDKHCLKNQNDSNSKFLPTFKNYSFENEPLNEGLPDIKPSTNKQKFKNDLNDNSVTPIIISNTNFYEDEDMLFSNINRKKLVNIYSNSDSSEIQKDHFLKIEAENLTHHNISRLCEKKELRALNCSSNTLSNDLTGNKDFKYFIKQTKKNNLNQFPNTNYTADHTQFLQPCLEYEKYKFQSQTGLQNRAQDQPNFGVNNSYNKNYYKMTYTDEKNMGEIKPDSSVNSWHKDDSQRKNISENNKIIQPKSNVSSVHANAYNSNISTIDDRCSKFKVQIDNNVELAKQYQYNVPGFAVEPLLSANKLPSHVNSHIHTKNFNKKYIPTVPSKNKSLAQLQMNPPDFSKISLIESTQKENESSRNTNEFSASHKKKYSQPLSFEEISKKYNYIKDLQLKNPISNDLSKCKEALKNNFDSQSHNCYSNLYVKAPDFSAENLSKSEIQKLNSNSLSGFNVNHMSTLSNDLPTIEPMHRKSYSDISTDKSPNIEITPVLNKANTSNEFYNPLKNKSKPIETNRITDDEYYEKCRVSDNCNKYYTSYPLHYEETPTYQTYSHNINIPTHIRNNNVPNTHIQDDRYSQNYFQEINNYRNCDGNMDYNIKRTTSVIQSGKHVNLDNSSNYISARLKNNSVPQSVPNNYNNKQQTVKTPQQEIPHYVSRNSPSLNTNKPILNNPQIIAVASSPANLQSPRNMTCGWQTKKEDTIQENSPHHSMFQNSNSSLKNIKSIQTAQKSLPLSKSIMKQSKTPQLPLDIPHCKVNTYCRNSESYFPTNAIDQHLLSGNMEKNISESEKYNPNTSKLIEYNNTANLYTEKNKHVKAIEYNSFITRPAFKNPISSAKCSPETPRPLQKPNYREMINHVYAMRNSITEDDLNLQIIKRTLNCDVSLRKSENDLSQNIFDFPVSKKSSSTYLTGNSYYYPRCDEKPVIARSQYDIDNTQNGYTDSHESYQEQSRNMSIANNDISVTLSKIQKLNEIKPFTVEMKNNINLNSDYPKAIITKVVNRKEDKSLPVEIDCIASRSHVTSTGSTTKKIIAPLDLSVKTVKTKADSTGCDDANIHNRIRIVEGTRSAPKFIFQPNFSNTADYKNEKNTILHSVTSSIAQKNTEDLLAYSNHMQSKNEIEDLNAADGRSCSNKIDGFTSAQINVQPASENITSKIINYEKDQPIANINKIKSKLLVPTSDIDLRIHGNSTYEYQKEYNSWQQPANTQNVDIIHHKNIILSTPEKFENKFEKLLKICNNNTNDLHVTNMKPLPVQNLEIRENCHNHANIQKYQSTVLQKTKNIKEYINKKHQIGNKIRNQNKIVRNNNRIDSVVNKTQTLPKDNKMDIDYAIRKRSLDITKQAPAKKIRVDDIYRAHLEETSKKQTNEVFNNNFIVDHIGEFGDIANHSKPKYENNDQNLVDSEFYPHLGYNHSQKLQKKIWYPPIESKYNQEKLILSHNPKPANIIFPGDAEDGLSIALSNNFTIPRCVDQNVISKLKNSIEMRENEKQKLAKLAEINERNKESSKSDIASLLAARIRTKGELKGFHQPVIAEIKNNNETEGNCNAGGINAKQLPVSIADSPEYEQNTALNLFDWRIACNDFVEQLKCGPNKKRSHKPRSTQAYTGESKELETVKSFSEIEFVCDIKNSLVSEKKIQYTSCKKRNNKELTNDSSDEDKPLLFLREQNKSQVSSVLPKTVENDTILPTLVCKESILQIGPDLDEASVNKSAHSSIVEKLSEKIGRNIREKQRIEQEKRLAARLDKTSSSESEDNKRNHRQKKISKMTRTRISAGVSTRELSDTDSSGAESISMSKNLIRSREVSRKRKAVSLESVDFILNTSKKTEESNIELPKVFNEKQVMTKAEMKFMVPSTEINRNILEQNEDKHFFLNKNKEVISKKANNCELITSKDLNAEMNKPKTKKLFSSNCDNRNTHIQLEETMTRSKRKKALENQIANSKILRNDKIINYIYIDRNKKTNDKKQRKSIRETKISRLKSEPDKKNIGHKNGISQYSSGSSVEFETETVSDRLRPRRLSLDNNRNCKRKVKITQKPIKEKEYNNKKTKLPNNKGNFLKKKINKERTDKYNTPKFPPGWQDQVYEYKKSLKVPLRLITIKAPHNNRISTSLPDLDSHSSDDATAKCSVGAKQKLSDRKPIQEQISINNNTPDKKLAQTPGNLEDEIQKKNSPPKSIIDVLHSRVIKSKKFPKKNVKTFNIYETKVLPRSTNELELLPTPTSHKTSQPLNEHHNVFKTEVLTSRTRTETRNLKNKELIREVFGGEDRPASAPPEIRKTDIKLETMTFEETYEQYLQKMNVDFGEKIRKDNKPIQLNEINNKVDQKNFINNASFDDDDCRFRTNEHSVVHNEFINRCIDNSGILKDKALRLISDQDGVAAPNSFKHKKNNKYRSGRRKGSSGFDYIRKKKKPSSAITSLSNQENLKRKKTSPIEFHHNRDENDVCKEIQKWVLNKSVGQSALHKAARLGYLDVIAYCLERMGMNPDPKDNAGYTPLHEACSKGRIDIARVLLQYGANHSETAHSGIRPLHEASENGYIEIVRLLLSYGADPLLTTYSGQTPLMLSESNEMEQFIKNHLYDVQNTGPHKQPWKFHGPWKIFDPYKYGYDVLSGAPDIEEIYDVDACDNDKCYGKENKSLPPDTVDKDRFILNSSCNLDIKVEVNSSIALDEGELFQLEEADIPLPPLYLLKDEGSAKWVLLSDLCNLLKVKSKDTLLKQICPSTPPSTINKELLRELKMSDFLEKATCLQLLCAGEKLNIRASKVILVKYNERVQTLLGVKTVVMKF